MPKKLTPKTTILDAQQMAPHEVWEHNASFFVNTGQVVRCRRRFRLHRCFEITKIGSIKSILIGNIGHFACDASSPWF